MGRGHEWRRLFRWEIDHRIRCGVEAGSRGGHDTNDFFVRRSIAGYASRLSFEAFAERILIRKEPPCDRLADDGDMRTLRDVALAEVTAGDQRNADGRKVRRRHPAVAQLNAATGTFDREAA